MAENSNQREPRRSVSAPVEWWLAYSMVIVAAVGLRCWLAWVNREANDNHHEVIRLLMDGYRSLSMRDCHECFHPKLYYVVCVAVFKSLGIVSADGQIVGAQLLNSLAGILMVAVIYNSLRRQSKHGLCVLLTFALVALNPKLIANNAQCSNDTFAMLFSTLAIYFAYRLLKGDLLAEFILVQFSLSAAIMTKGTTWVVAIAVCMVFAGRALFGRGSQFRYSAFAVLSVLVALGSVWMGNYDFENYGRYAHLGKGKPLYLFEPTVVGRPGVISIADSYLTFRLFDLLAHPMNTHARELDPVHRSSVWTQLYGRTHFAHFDDHPRSWRTRHPLVMNLGRAILLLALVPTGIFFVGLIIHARRFWQGIFRDSLRYFSSGEEYLYLLVAAGYFAFIIKFTYDYRDFAAMKAIYVYPGMLAFASIFLVGLEATFRMFDSRPRLCNSIVVGLVALLFLYAMDIQLLIDQLETMS